MNCLQPKQLERKAVNVSCEAWRLLAPGIFCGVGSAVPSCSPGLFVDTTAPHIGSDMTVTKLDAVCVEPRIGVVCECVTKSFQKTVTCVP